MIHSFIRRLEMEALACEQGICVANEACKIQSGGFVSHGCHLSSLRLCASIESRTCMFMLRFAVLSSAEQLRQPQVLPFLCLQRFSHHLMQVSRRSMHCLRFHAHETGSIHLLLFNPMLLLVDYSNGKLGDILSA